MKKWRLQLQQHQLLHSAALPALICFCSFAFTLIHASSSRESSAAAAQLQEVSILLEFKQTLIDADGNLHSWAASDISPCNWEGVVCTNNTVTALDLSHFNLNGTVPTAICKLRNLQSLNLTYNNFNQDFPYGLLGCGRLIVLDLSQNYFTGPLPHNISVLAPSLTHLDLSGNFEGPIPDDFWELRNLRTLHLMDSSLSGTLPSQIGKLSNLTSLDLRWNPLSPAAIPAEIGNLTQLQFLQMAGCQFFNDIPASIGALKQLVYLDLAANNLSGGIPSELMELPKLQVILLFQNQLSGPLPPAFVNLTLLTDFYVGWNNLSGIIPKEISQLQHLRVFELYSNQFTGELPDGLADLPNLQCLDLYSNSLNGSIPQMLGQTSPLLQFDVTNNFLTGPLPAHLCDGGKLQSLMLINNMLSGKIPDTYGNCPSLIRVKLHGNRLQGAVPAGLWGSPSMAVLDVGDNDLNGSISSAIGGASKLSFLILDNNRFSGDLPREIGQLPQLSVFSAISNHLSGPIPPFGNCSSLASLSLAFNSISGELPPEIINCKGINYIDLAHNNLSGTIPNNLAHLPQLKSLNLSTNQLSGEIPSQLGAMEFLSFNVSYNDLDGAVPSELLGTFSVTGFEGNPNLCGEGLPRSCSATFNSTALREEKESHLAWIVVGVIAPATLLMIALIIVHRRCRGQRAQRPLWEITTFQKLGFSAESVANNLKEENVIGRGGSGEVYKVNLLDGEAVAVKKLCGSQLKQGSQAKREMEVELETLSRIRHRNIVRLLCCCSSNEAQLLMFEYMPDGSLGDLLHGQNAIFLSWQARYEIALGAANGLSYLHHDCHPAILHRDIKSNNILLSFDFGAKLADFGLAKLVQAGRPISMTAVAGSYGYIAPEYAYTLKVDEKVDVYSFGVVLLELVTGKRPIEAEFGDEADLVRWVRSKIHMEGDAIDLLDPRIRDSDQRTEMSMKLCLKLAMRCTSELAQLRPSMRDVVEILLQLNPGIHS